MSELAGGAMPFPQTQKETCWFRAAGESLSLDGEENLQALPIWQTGPSSLKLCCKILPKLWIPVCRSSALNSAACPKSPSYDGEGLELFRWCCWGSQQREMVQRKHARAWLFFFRVVLPWPPRQGICGEREAASSFIFLLLPTSSLQTWCLDTPAPGWAWAWLPSPGR